MPLGSVSDFVNQLVLTNTYSFRTPSGSGSRVRSDLRQFVAPRLVVHSLWPSHQVTHGTKEMMESLRMQHAQNVDESTVSQPIDEWKLYLDAVGGKNKKNIIYGLGSSQSIFYGSGKYQNNTSGSSHCDDQDHQNTQTQLQEMKNLVKSMQEEHENRLKAMESRLSMMFEARTNGHPDSPPDADLDGHIFRR